MKSFTRNFALAFIVFSPFATWFALSGWLRLPVVLILLLVVISTPILILSFLRKPTILVKDREDILLYVFLLVIFISFLFGFFNQRSFNHTLSYIFSIIFLFALFKVIIVQLNISVETIAKFVAVSVLLNNGIIIIEWLLLNFADIIIRDNFLTGGRGTSNMMYYTHTFFKAVAGTGEEPGGTASLLNIYFPIGLWYLKQYNSKTLTIVYIIIHLIALTFLASVAGVVFLLLAYIIWSLYKVKLLLKYAYTSLIIIVIAASVYNLNLFDVQRFSEKYYSYIMNKVTLSNSNESASIRKNMWKNAITDWTEKPLLGHGPGYGVEKYTSGYFNTYLTLLADAGFFACLFFTTFIIIIFLKLFKLPDFDLLFLFISMGCLILHSSIYYVYYHEPFWLPMIIIQLLYSRNFRNQTSNSDTNTQSSIVSNASGPEPTIDTIR